MDKLTAIKIKYNDGTYSDEIPVSVLSKNVEWDSTHTLVDILGSIDVNVTGTIQDQISRLFNEKVNATDLSNYVNSTMKTEITTWLNKYISPATGTIAYDASLSIEGAAADAKAVGNLKEGLQLENQLFPIYKNIEFIDSFIVASVAGGLDRKGNWYDDSSQVIDKYRVSAGEIIYISSGFNAWQFRRWANKLQANIPEDKVGSVHKNDGERYVVVPSGVQFLIVSKSSNDSTNYVKKINRLLNLPLHESVLISPYDFVIGSYTYWNTPDKKVIYELSYSRIRTVSPFKLEQGRKIHCNIPSGYNICVGVFKEDLTFIKEIKWTSTYLEYTAESTCVVLPVIKKTDGSTITASEAFAITIDPLLDASLSIEGVAADAKAVGNAVREQFTELKNDLENLEDKAIVYENVTDEYDAAVGQAYGNVGSTITFSTSNGYKHVRIPKSDNIAFVNFSAIFDVSDVSSYIQYVDDDDIIISRDYVMGDYDLGKTYKYRPRFPDGATGMYVTGGILSYAFNITLEIYKQVDSTSIADDIKKKIATIKDDLDENVSDLRQDQTAYIECESGTYEDSDGATKRSRNTRIRNVRPVCVKGYDAIVIPDGYQAWILRLDKNETYISAVGQWKSGKVMFTDILTDATKYINFGIMNIATPNSDISGEIGIVENGLILIPTIVDDFKKKADRDYNEIVKSVCRIADGLSVPHQSIIGYKTAYKNGFRAMLCDLRFTSDNVAVLEHDAYLNEYYSDVYLNGTLVEPNTVAIANTTYSDLLQYDFGYYKGEAYAGTKIMTFEQMLNLCKCLGCEVHIETKVSMTTAQYDIVFGLIRQYGMEQKCVWNPQSVQQLADLIAYEPNVYINLHSNLSSGQTLPDSRVNAIIGATTDYNKHRNSITLTYGGLITASQVEALSKAGVGIMGTTINTKQQVLDYYNQGKPYTSITSVLSDTVIAGKVLFDSIMS